jgi:hypothetical protein
MVISDMDIPPSSSQPHPPSNIGIFFNLFIILTIKITYKKLLKNLYVNKVNNILYNFYLYYLIYYYFISKIRNNKYNVKSIRIT